MYGLWNEWGELTIVLFPICCARFVFLLRRGGKLCGSLEVRFHGQHGFELPKEFDNAQRHVFFCINCDLLFFDTRNELQSQCINEYSVCFFGLSPIAMTLFWYFSCFKESAMNGEIWVRVLVTSCGSRYAIPVKSLVSNPQLPWHPRVSRWQNLGLLTYVAPTSVCVMVFDSCGLMSVFKLSCLNVWKMFANKMDQDRVFSLLASFLCFGQYGPQWHRRLLPCNAFRNRLHLSIMTLTRHLEILLLLRWRFQSGSWSPLEQGPRQVRLWTTAFWISVPQFEEDFWVYVCVYPFRILAFEANNIKYNENTR